MRFFVLLIFIVSVGAEIGPASHHFELENNREFSSFDDVIKKAHDCQKHSVPSDSKHEPNCECRCITHCFVVLNKSDSNLALVVTLSTNNYIQFQAIDLEGFEIEDIRPPIFS